MQSPAPSSEATLSTRQKNMVIHLKETNNKTSLIAPGFFLFSCFGKLIFGFGASLTVKGICTNDIVSTAAGGSLCGFGFICILIVAFGFGAACSRIDRRWGITLKCVSIASAILIAAGYAINQYYISTHRSLMDIRLTFLPLFLGAGLLTISIANFSAYTELVRGRSPGLPFAKRPLIAICLIGLGIGTVFGGWITGEKGEWPIAFNAAVLTVAMACLYGGVCLFWSDHIRREAEWAERCTIIAGYRGMNGIIELEGKDA